MAPEKQIPPPENQTGPDPANFDENYAGFGVPMHIFPAPPEHVSDHFNPYDNPDDRELYIRAGGNMLYALGLRQIQMIRNEQASGQGYGNYDQRVQGVLRSMDAIEGNTVKKPHWPPET